jgi:phosphoribosylglycinamide formyltransferase 2
VDRALAEPDTALRLFGKPEVRGHRRMGVSLALGATVDEARTKARRMTELLGQGVRCE